MRNKLFIVILISIVCFLFSRCKKDENKTIYVDGNNISIAGDTTHYNMIEDYSSDSELVTLIQVSYNSCLCWTDTGNVVYSIPINNLEEGDIIFASGNAELSGIGNYVHEIVGMLLLADSMKQLPYTTAISNESGSNYTPDMGTFISTHFGSYKCTQSDTGNKYVSFCLRAITGTSHPLGILTIEHGFGSLSVTVHKKIN